MLGTRLKSTQLIQSQAMNTHSKRTTERTCQLPRWCCPTDPMRWLGQLLVCVLAWSSSIALAQSQSNPTDASSPAIKRLPADEARTIHPGVLLGRRAGAQLAQRQVIPVVVIVPEPVSYSKAIGTWTKTMYFPVLIDDGSWQSREDIARFVRSFKPRQVIRWQAEDVPAAAKRMRPHRAIANAKTLTNQALAAVAGIDAGDDATEVPMRPGVPAGIIAADARDPAWTAALALSAARNEPIYWTSFPKLGVNGFLLSQDARDFDSSLASFTASLGVPWNGLGDTIDAITICGSLPGRVQMGDKDNEFIATTDLLGRKAGDARWAWAGQIFGSEASAAYKAMSSVFLTFHAAWLFDSYANTAPWVQWDCTKASKVLKERGLLVMLDDEPHNTYADWQLRAERPVHADLIFVTSSGNRSWFQIGPQRARTGDIPMLEVPSVVSFVHSWSAVAPDRITTIAGRWFSRGAYAYIGSVHEPYLQAFVPTPILTNRLMAGMALGPAAHLDSGPPWRIGVFGDPLIAHRPESPRLDTSLPLTDTQDLAQTMKQSLKAGDYAKAIECLNMLGRDADGVKLMGALRRDKPEAFDTATAKAGLFMLYRTGQDDAFIHAFGLLSQADAADTQAVDALWHVARRVMRQGGSEREALVPLLATHIREDQKEQDAAVLRRYSQRRP